jgi:hypothetical protein
VRKFWAILLRRHWRGRVGRALHANSDKEKPARVLLTVLCVEAETDKFSEMFLRETSASGIQHTIGETAQIAT